MNSHRRVKTAAIPSVPQPTTYVQVFVLSEILPDHCCLVLDLFHRSVTVLRFEDTALASCHACFSLTPSAARVLACMLRASPASCSYQALFAALYPLGSDAGGWEPTLGLRPIRRALRALAPVLRQLGLQVVALRGQGYLLVGAPRPEETGRAPSLPSRGSAEQEGQIALTDEGGTSLGNADRSFALSTVLPSVGRRALQCRSGQDQSDKRS